MAGHRIGKKRALVRSEKECRAHKRKLIEAPCIFFVVTKALIEYPISERRRDGPNERPCVKYIEDNWEESKSRVPQVPRSY